MGGRVTIFSLASGTRSSSWVNHVTWVRTVIPELATPRLRLRGFRPDDAEPYIAMMMDREVSRYLGDLHPLSRVDAWRQLALMIGHWTLRGFGIWAVEERASGEFIGRIGCFEPEGWPAFEIGYTLARSSWGKGYAKEGARAALTFARTELGRRDIVSLIRPANVASIRVATALGAVHDGEVELLGATSLVYRYPAEALDGSDPRQDMERVRESSASGGWQAARGGDLVERWDAQARGSAGSESAT